MASGNVKQPNLFWEILIVVPVKSKKEHWLYIDLGLRKGSDLIQKFRGYHHKCISRSERGISSRESIKSLANIHDGQNGGTGSM